MGRICHLGSFVPWDVFSLGCFVSWDVFSLGRFVSWDVMHRQNVPRQNVPKDKTSQDKTSQGQNVLKDKTSQVQNVPRDKMSQGTKRPTPISVITKFSKTHFVLENWPYMYGNGPHSCSQFMIGVLLVWGG